jgi:MFS family permease
VNTTTSAAAQAYLDRLRRELADLPASEVEEIVQDLEPQVAALAAELDAEPSLGTMDDHLGDPAEYARELRSAMGVDTTARTPLWVSRTTLWIVAVTTVGAVVGAYLTGRVISNDPRPVLWFVAFGLFASWFTLGRHRSTIAEIAELPEVRQAKERLAAAEQHLPVAAYVTSLRPGLRLVKAALVWLGVVWLFGWFGWLGAGGATAAFAFAVLSMWTGNRAEQDRRWLWLSVPLTGWAVGVAVKSMALLPLLATGDHVWP